MKTNPALLLVLLFACGIDAAESKPPRAARSVHLGWSAPDGEIFYIIKNGIRFTGMPGWGGEDEENWKLVLFIRHLSSLTAREIELMNEINALEKEGGSEKTSTPQHEQSKPHGH